MSKAALCGTDSAEWDHGPLLARPPVMLGHEFTGKVVAAGPEPAGFPPGTRVVSGAGISCGTCEWCAAGRTNLCARYQTLGLHLDGGLAELVLSPASICRPVPDGLDDTSAAMAQPLAVAMHAARRGRVGPGRSCAVIGTGGIGAFIVAAAAALGASPLIAIDVADGRLATAAALGATRTANAGRDDAPAVVRAATGEQGAHVVIEASGAPDSPAAALAMVRRGGDVVIVGLQPHPAGLDLFSVSTREVDVHGTLAHVCGEDLAEAVAVLASTPLAARYSATSSASTTWSRAGCARWRSGKPTARSSSMWRGRPDERGRPGVRRMQLMRAQSHVGITVRDLDASVYFYHDLLGLEIATEPSPWFDGPELGHGVGVPGAALRQVCLRLGDTMLELLEYRTPPSATAAPAALALRGRQPRRLRRRRHPGSPGRAGAPRGAVLLRHQRGGRRRAGRLALGVLRRPGRLPAGTRGDRVRAAGRPRRGHRPVPAGPAADTPGKAR